MRQRDMTKIDRITGEVTETTELLPDATFEQRFAELKASVPFDQATHRMVDLRCDGCSRLEHLDPSNPKLPPGWQEQNDGDYCPACVEAR